MLLNSDNVEVYMIQTSKYFYYVFTNELICLLIDHEFHKGNNSTVWFTMVSPNPYSVSEV